MSFDVAPTGLTLAAFLIPNETGCAGVIELHRSDWGFFFADKWQFAKELRRNGGHFILDDKRGAEKVENEHFHSQY